jgi:hypothetical protein
MDVKFTKKEKLVDKVWKIRHKLSGLFYQTVKGRFSDKITNLGPRGKIYQVKPSFKQLAQIRVSNYQVGKFDLNVEHKSWSTDNYLIHNDYADFEIVEYDLKEIK